MKKFWKRIQSACAPDAQEVEQYLFLIELTQPSKKYVYALAFRQRWPVLSLVVVSIIQAKKAGYHLR